MPRVPPLQSVESFVIAARLGNFRAAADHLAVSVSAFSRRIQQLELAVGVALFERSTSGVRLTGAGEQYLAQIQLPLAAIRRATVSLRNTSPVELLRVATSHSFAANWLLPRIVLLQEAAGIQIELRIARDFKLLQSGEVDLAIWGGAGPRAHSEELFVADGVPVTAGNSSATFQSIEQIAEQPLLGVREPDDMWSRWFDNTGCVNLISPPAQHETLRAMYDSAAAGLGVTLAIPVLSEPYLQTGLLRACVMKRSSLGTGYRIYFATSAQKTRAATMRLKHCLKTEISHSCRQFDMWWTSQLAQA